MSVFFIVGLFGCRKYVTAEYQAQHLVEQFTDIQVKCQAFSEAEFRDILRKMKPVLHCNHSGSPFIWKDIPEIGACPIYIGGVNEFLKFCADNYGPGSVLTPEQVQVSNYKNGLTNAIPKVESVRRITVYGARNPASSLLIMEALLCDSLYERDGLEIRVYDPRPGTNKYLKALVWDMLSVNCPNLYRRKVIHAGTEGIALEKTDLIVMMLESERKRDEEMYTWLMRNNQLMAEAAYHIDTFCSNSPRLVVSCIKLLCFNAQALLKHSKILKAEQVIANTNHLGLEILMYLSTATAIPVREIFAPPVWGYVGLNQLVDTCHTKCNYRVWEITAPLRRVDAQWHDLKLIDDDPRQRFDDGPPPVVTEERDMCFRSHSLEYIWRWVGEHKRSVRNIHGGDPYMSQVNSTIETIRLWYDSDKRPRSEVISAGISSPGKRYGIPMGLVFSQPVFLEEGIWKPYEDLEEPHFQIKLRYLLTLPLIISRKFQFMPNLDSLIQSSFYPEKEKPKTRKMSLAEQKEKLMKVMAQTDERPKSHVDKSYKSPEEESKERELKKNQIKSELRKLRQELRDMDMMKPESTADELNADRVSKEDGRASQNGILSKEESGPQKGNVSAGLQNGVALLGRSGKENDDNDANKNNMNANLAHYDDDDLIKQPNQVNENIAPERESSQSKDIQEGDAANEELKSKLSEELNEDYSNIPDIDYYKEIFAEYYYRKLLTLHDDIEDEEGELRTNN